MACGNREGPVLALDEEGSASQPQSALQGMGHASAVSESDVWLVSSLSSARPEHTQIRRVPTANRHLLSVGPPMHRKSSQAKGNTPVLPEVTRIATRSAGTASREQALHTNAATAAMLITSPANRPAPAETYRKKRGRFAIGTQPRPRTPRGALVPSWATMAPRPLSYHQPITAWAEGHGQCQAMAGIRICGGEG